MKCGERKVPGMPVLPTMPRLPVLNANGHGQTTGAKRRTFGGKGSARHVPVTEKLPVVRADQSPLNKMQWRVVLACGHVRWVTATVAPVTAHCYSCAKEPEY
jgi:hypothetical protein